MTDWGDQPELKLEGNIVANWDEIQGWAFCNDNTWNFADKTATYLKMDEVQRLRLITISLLHRKRQAERDHLNLVMSLPPKYELDKPA